MSNVISLKDRKPTKKEQENSDNFDFSDIIEQNKLKRNKLMQDKQKKNNGVLKRYRIK